MNLAHERFMRLAIRQAHLARQLGDVPFGAVVVYEGEVISAAHNSEHLDADITSHAETKAMSAACHALGRRDLSACTLYSSNEPCLMCATAAFYGCMPRIVYALSRDDLPGIFRPRKIRLAELAHDSSNPPEIIAGVCRIEALELYSDISSPFRVVPSFTAAHS
jgi:tRNA(Arg) A34 adenosine deaminase TadA